MPLLLASIGWFKSEHPVRTKNNSNSTPVNHNFLRNRLTSLKPRYLQKTMYRFHIIFLSPEPDHILQDERDGTWEFF